MRQSKKILSIVLALVMMVGMVVPGFSVSAASTPSDAADWQAHWIWQEAGEDYSSVKTFTIDYDFQIENAASGFIFGASDLNNMLMWQVNTADYDYVALRPHNWVNGAAAVIQPEVDLSNVFPSKEDAIGKTAHMTIAFDNGNVVTSINGTVVDERNVGDNWSLGKIGFRQTLSNDGVTPEVSLFDNLEIKGEDGTVLFADDFSDSNNPNFPQGTVTDDGMLRVSNQIFLQNDNASDPQAANTWMNLRKTVNLDSVPDSVIAKISVDSRYWMWINGEMVVFEGQLKRGPTPDDTYYEEVEIAPYLQEGENTIAILAWYYGREGYAHKNSGKAGFLFEADFGDQLVISDESWKVKKNPAYQNDPDPVDQPNYRFAEENIYYDARQDLGEWYLPGYDDSSWDNAVVLGEVGCEPWNDLYIRTIPQLKDYGMTSYLNPEEFAPYTETATTEPVTLTMEVPYNAQLTTYLKVDAPAGLEISMKTDNYSDPAGNGNTVMSTYITKDGVQEFEALGWMNGQYVYYEIPAGVKVLDLQYRETGYNTEFEGSFTSDDWFFNKLWEQSKRTLYVTMRDNFMDCPDRERAQWWGDVNNEMMMMMYSLDTQSYDLYKKGVDTMVNWARDDGTMMTVCPTGNSDYELPLQNLAGIWGFSEYYLYTADAETIATAYDMAKTYVDLWSFGSNGLVIHRPGQWDWPDWGSHADTAPQENAWYYLALQSCKAMAEVLGKTEDIASYDSRMKSIELNYDKVFWTGEYYYSSTDNGIPDDRANAMAVLSGLASEDKYPAIKEVLTTVQNSSPYFEKYVLDALCEMGYMEEAQARIKDRYYDMTANPETAYSTLWEFWDKNAGTKNHAWTGGPLITMSKYMAGVEPTTPGYTTYEITPDMGTVNSINCVVPAIQGDITVNLLRDPDAKTLSMEFTSPEGTTALVGVPRFEMENTIVKCGDTVLFADGEAVDTVEGLTYVGNDAEYIYFNAVPGTYALDASVDMATEGAFALNIDANAGGTIQLDGEEITTPYSAQVEAGTVVTLEAIPEEGYQFDGFTGTVGSDDTAIEFTVGSDVTLNATFSMIYGLDDLQEEVDTANGTDRTQYTDVTLSDLDEAIATAEAVIAKADEATVAEVSSAIDSLRAALNGLRLKAVSIEASGSTDIINSKSPAQIQFTGKTATGADITLPSTSDDIYTVTYACTDPALVESGKVSIDEEGNVSITDDIGVEEIAVNVTVAYDEVNVTSNDVILRVGISEINGWKNINSVVGGETSYTRYLAAENGGFQMSGNGQYAGVTNGAMREEPVDLNDFTLEFTVDSFNKQGADAWILVSLLDGTDFFYAGNNAPSMGLGMLIRVNGNEIQFQPHSTTETFSMIDSQTSSLPAYGKHTVSVYQNEEGRYILQCDDIVFDNDKIDSLFKDYLTDEEGNATAYLTMALHSAVNEFGTITINSVDGNSVRAPMINPETGAETSSVIKDEAGTFQFTTQQDVQTIALFNEYDMKMGLKSLTYTDNEDGTRTWTASASIGTIGNDRIFSIYTIGEDGVYTDSKVDLYVDVLPPQDQPVAYSAQFDSDTAKINVPVNMTIVTDTSTTKVTVYNEYGVSFGSVREYTEVDGQRIWVIPIKISTYGERTISAVAYNKYGIRSAESPSDNISVRFI